MPQSSLRRDLPLILALATLAAAESAQLWLGARLAGVRVAWPHAIEASTPSWILLALLLVPVLHLMDRPLLRSRAGWLVWGGVALGLSLAHLTGTAVVAEWMRPSGLGLRGTLAGLLSLYFVPDLMTVVAILSLWTGFQNRQREDALRLTRARTEAATAEARFETLRGRLRPDFIFNTLNASAALVAQGSPAEGAAAISSLGTLLRGCLSVDPGQPIPMARELDLVADYLAIQRLRYPGRVTTSIQMATTSRSVPFPALAAVSIVEAVVEEGLNRGGDFSLGISVEGEARVQRLTVRSSVLPLHASQLDRVAASVGESSGLRVGILDRSVILEPADSPVAAGAIEPQHTVQNGEFL